MMDPAPEFAWIPTEELLAGPAFPPREAHPSLELIVSSVRLNGVLTPLLVRRLEDASLQIVCGHRRALAAREAGVLRVPVLVHVGLSDVQAIRFYLSENTCRHELSVAQRDLVLRLLRDARDRGVAPAAAPGKIASPSEAARDRSEGGGSAEDVVRSDRLPSEREGRGVETAGAADFDVSRLKVPSGAPPSIGAREIFAVDEATEGPSRRVADAVLERDENRWLACREELEDLLEETRGLLDEVRSRRMVDLERAERIVARILDLPPGAPRSIEIPEEIGPTWLARHSLHVALLNRAAVVGRGDRRLARLASLCGLLHDVGMVFLEKRSFLFDASALSVAETREVESHTRLGYALLSHLDRDLRDVGLAARDHHERRDGSGYPSGLAGHEVSWLAQLTAVTDSLAAMTSARSHRERRTEEDALAELRSSGSAPRYDALSMRDVARLFLETGETSVANDGAAGRLASVLSAATPVDLY